MDVNDIVGGSCSTRRLLLLQVSKLVSRQPKEAEEKKQARADSGSLPVWMMGDITPYMYLICGECDKTHGSGCDRIQFHQQSPMRVDQFLVNFWSHRGKRKVPPN